MDRVLIAQSADSFGASSKVQFFVSVSRGHQAATVNTDNKSDLLDAVRRSDERMSAVELLSAEMLADRTRSLKDPARREEPLENP